MDKEELKARILNDIRNLGTWFVPVTTHELCNDYGLKPRQLRNIIQDLREEYPIVSREDEGGGYWVADNNEEIEEFVERIRQRKLRYEKTIRIMKKHLK